MEGLNVEPVRFATADAGEEAFARFRRDGYLVLDQFIAADFAGDLLAALRARHPDYFVTTEGRYAVGDRRFIAPVVMSDMFADPRLIMHEGLTAVADGLLGRRWVIDAFGVVVSLPGSEDQHIHHDGGMLFGIEPLDRMLPTTALTVGVPLVAVDASHGRTELWPGTHRTPGPVDGSEPGAEPDVLPGSAALWDFRIRHRGRANHSDEPRPFLYFTLCLPWWIDHRNFKRDGDPKLLIAAATFAALPELWRKRFERVVVID